MNPFVKALCQGIAIMLIFMSIAYYAVCIRPQERITCDININRFKQYNDSPLYFRRYIQSSVLFKQMKKRRRSKQFKIFTTS